MASDPPAAREGPTPLGPAAPSGADFEMQLAMRTLMSSMLGRVRDVHLGRYVVRERLGHGGCGLVLLAEDPELDREVAIKVVLPARDREGSATWQRALQREAQALARLRHPNVVEIYDTGTAPYGSDAGGVPRTGVYMVMERLRGQTLRAWLAAAPRSWREVLDVHVQAARGLVAAHQAGIVHRDFKPDNVLLTKDGRVVLIDFGLADETHALDLSDPDSVTGAQSARLDDDSGAADTTRPSRVVGTPTYMAPEQHLGHAVGAAADQYAWCVSLFAALYGAPPFRGDTMAELAARKLEARLPPPVAGPPRALYRVLRRGLSPQPRARYAELADLLAAIDRASAARRSAAPLALASLGCAAVAAWTAFGTPAAHPCDAQPLALDAVWNPARQHQIATALGQLRDPNAAALAQRVTDRLDVHAARWRAAYELGCASDVRTATLPAQLECLDRGRSQLDGVAAALTALTAETVDNASALLDGLHAPDACLAAGATARGEAERRELAELWRGADAAGVHIDATGTLEDPAWAEQALARADALDDAALASTLAWRLSQHARAAGKLDEAERHIRTAVFRAAAAHDHARALELMPMLVLSVGSDLGDRAGAEQLIAHAKVMAEHVDDPRAALAAVDNALAYIHIEKGEPEEAVAIYRRSLAVFEALDEPSSEYARCLLALAGWSLEQNDLEAGAAYLARAKKVLDEVALPTDTNYASIAFQEGGIAEAHGDFVAAAAGYRTAVERLRVRVHGHPFVGVGLSALASMEARLGHFVEAAKVIAEARQLALDAHGPAHPDSLRYELQHARIAWLAGDDAETLAAVDRALVAMGGLGARQDDYLPAAHHLGAWSRLATGDVDAAAAHLAVLQAMPGPDGAPGLDRPRSERRLAAVIALARGDVATASAALARSIATPVATPDHEPALEHALDAVLWRRIAAAGGRVPDGLPRDGDAAALRVDRRVSYEAMVRTFAAALDRRGPALAATARP